MNTTFRVLVLASFGIAFTTAFPALSTPVDTRDAKRLPELRAIAAVARGTNALSDAQRQVLAECLSTNSIVLTAIVAGILADTKEQEALLWSRLKEKAPNYKHTLADAFIRLALVRKDCREKNLAELENAITSLLKDKNPFLRLEAARLLCKLNPDQGKSELEKLLLDDDILVKREAEWRLRESDNRMKSGGISMYIEQYRAILWVLDEEH